MSKKILNKKTFFSELADRAKDPQIGGRPDQRRDEGGSRTMGVQG